VIPIDRSWFGGPGREKRQRRRTAQKGTTSGESWDRAAPGVAYQFLAGRKTLVNSGRQNLDRQVRVVPRSGPGDGQNVTGGVAARGGGRDEMSGHLRHWRADQNVVRWAGVWRRGLVDGRRGREVRFERREMEKAAKRERAWGGRALYAPWPARRSAKPCLDGGAGFLKRVDSFHTRQGTV